VRCSSVAPCHSREALARPIRDDRPPARTTPAAAPVRPTTTRC